MAEVGNLESNEMTSFCAGQTPTSQLIVRSHSAQILLHRTPSETAKVLVEYRGEVHPE